ncbi:unnamed protein product [Vicia faba]|uniref:Uncharacterized protein n=1 Tax=Vicia faba TaxID=3906 RepID=A0AAV1AFJ2_VICFA|nr:unnamed protein product [Vicia faba]
MQKNYKGSTKVNRAQLQYLQREFEILAMGEDVAKPINHMSDVKENGEIELINEQGENVVNDKADNNGEAGNIDSSDDSEIKHDNSNNLSARPRNPSGYLRDYVTGLENIDNQNPNHLQNLEVSMFSSNEC